MCPLDEADAELDTDMYVAFFHHLFSAGRTAFVHELFSVCCTVVNFTWLQRQIGFQSRPRLLA